MADDAKTYQPGWGEKREKRHHRSHHYRRSKERNSGIGGALRLKDKQAYYGLLVVIAVVALFGAYKLVRLIGDELRSIPMDDPTTERAVDELRIHKADEQDALILGDSLAQAYQVDSMLHKVQIETTPAYRYSKIENKWYLTKRDWKALKKNWRIWRWAKKRGDNG